MATQTSTAALFSPIQHVRWFSRPRLIVWFWLGAILTVVVMAWTTPVGWDAQVCWRAVQSAHQASDPYAEGIATLRGFHQRLASNPAERPPLVYVYSPMTLPLLRLLAAFPAWLLGLFYWAAIATGALLQLWAGFQMAEERERRWLALMLPALAFFPGLITDDVFLSGNVAYILYGAILTAATVGWKRGHWFWYYLAVLAASVFKAPFLVLLAFPVLVEIGTRNARPQWLQSGITAIAGVLIFAAQMRLWPNMFREYLLTLRLMFDWEHDFGFGPAGILGRALWRRELPSSLATTILYLAVAGMLGAALLFIARRVREWNLPRTTWVPIAFVGVALLNPRIMKYDLAPLTVPMLLIAWRALRVAFQSSPSESHDGDSNQIRDHRSARALVLVAALCFLIPNIITVAGPTWFPIELVVLLVVFAMAVRSIYRPPVEVQPSVAPPEPAADLLLALELEEVQ